MEGDQAHLAAPPAWHTWPVPLLREVRLALEAAGYQVTFRVVGWTECFTRRDAERWLGRGIDESDALANALEQMLPSHLGRHLAATRVGAVLTALGAATAVDAEVAPTSSDQTSRVPEGTDAVPAAVGAGGSHDSTVADACDGAGASAEVPIADTPIAAPANGEPPVAGAAPAAPPRTSAQDGQHWAILGALGSEIDGQTATCARLAPAQVRAQLLVWICRARAVQEAHPSDAAVIDAVGALARRLTDLAKKLWPGSVHALQLATRPEQVARGPGTPKSWAQAESYAFARLAEERDAARRTGCDDDGWADALARAPQPPAPDETMRQIEVELESITGTAPFASSEIVTLLSVARTLRWIRGAVSDDMAWGAAMGRLRRLAVQGTEGDLGELRRTLDPLYRPPVPWSVQPRTSAAAPLAEPPPAERVEVLQQELPRVAEAPDRLLEWLVRSFDVLSTPDLATMVAPYAGRVAAVGAAAEEHADRRVRRRLRDLLARLAEASAAGAPTTDPAAPSLGAAVAHGAETARGGDGDASGGAELELLLGRVRPLTEGRRVLLVSNRLDPALETKLTTLLGVQITGCEGSLRRVQAQCARIGSGAYDLVLSATGFQMHGTDGALFRACRSAKVPYIRADRCRPLACVQALARELGVQRSSP